MIKPTASTRLMSAYSCPSSLYSPDDQAIWQVLEVFAGRSNATDALRRAEQLADIYQVNILGATFLAIIELARLETRLVFCADVAPARSDIVGKLYPDLQERIAARKFSRAVANNLGRFVVLMTFSRDATSRNLCGILADMKIRYRVAVARFVAVSATAVRDHLVHVPETVNEARYHMRVLRSCITD